MKISIDTNTEEYIVSEYLESQDQRFALPLEHFNDITIDVAYAVAAICLDFVNKFIMDEKFIRETSDCILQNAESIIENYIDEKFETARKTLN